jgi:hypothetical protein
MLDPFQWFRLRHIPWELSSRNLYRPLGPCACWAHARKSKDPCTQLRRSGVSTCRYKICPSRRETTHFRSKACSLSPAPVRVTWKDITVYSRIFLHFFGEHNDRFCGGRVATSQLDLYSEVGRWIIAKATHSIENSNNHAGCARGLQTSTRAEIIRNGMSKTSKNQRLENTPPQLQKQLVEFEQNRRPAANVHIYLRYRAEFCWSENYDNEFTL